MADPNRLMRGRNGAERPQRDVKVSAPAPGASIPSKISKFIFYGGIITVLITLVVVLFHFSTFGLFTIDFKTGSISRLPITPNMRIPPQYVTYPIPAPQSTTFESVLQTRYSVAFDLNIADATPLQNSYRVIFYNGAQTPDPTLPSDDLSQTNNIGSALKFYVPVTDGSSGPNTATRVDPTSLITIQSALFANSTNLCMYMAPDTNDLYLTYFIGHVTAGTMGSLGVLNADVESLDGWAVSKPITNVPIGRPFRISLVVDEQFIETYINGELVLITKTFIPGQSSNLHSYSSSNNYNFYGPPDTMYLKGINVANIQYWNQILPSKAIRVFSSVPSKASVFSS